MRLPDKVQILELEIPIVEVSTLEDSFCHSSLYEGAYGEEIVPVRVQSVPERMVFVHELGHVLGIVHEQDPSEDTAWKYARLLLGNFFDEARYKELLEKRRVQDEITKREV